MNSTANIISENNTKKYTINVITKNDVAGNFMIILPGKYKLVEKPEESNINYLDRFSDEEKKSLFKNTIKNSSEFKIDEINLPESATTYDTLMKFLRVCIGSDYIKILGEDMIDYFTNLYNPIFKKPTDLTSEEITANIELFKNTSLELSETINLISKKYKALYNSEDYKSTDLNGYNIQDFNDNTSIIKIDKIEDTISYYNKNNMVDKINSDIMTMLIFLAYMSELSSNFNKTANPYRNAVIKVINNMRGNYTITNYYRDIIHHSVFKLAIDGFPFNTKSKMVYTVNKISNIDNKLKYLQTTLSNIEALTKAFVDFNYFENTVDFSNIVIQEKLIINAYAILCDLIALKAELTSYDRIFELSFMSDSNVKRDPLRTTPRYEYGKIIK